MERLYMKISEDNFLNIASTVPFEGCLPEPVECPEDFDPINLNAYKYENNKITFVAKRAQQIKWAQAREERLEAKRRIAEQKLLKRQSKFLIQQCQQQGDVEGVIDLCPFLSDWSPGTYAVNDIVVYEESPWRCVQAHNSTGNLSWNPMDARALWANYHAKSSENALPWIQPSGAHDAYQMGEWMIWTDEKTYKCTGMAVVHGPDAAPQLWNAM